jgi:hypothetical protein
MEITKMSTCAAKWEYIENILNSGTQIDKNSVIFIKLFHLHPKKCSKTNKIPCTGASEQKKDRHGNYN